MRFFAWLLVLGLFLFAGLCVLVSYQVGDASNQRAELRSLAIAVSGFVPHQAKDTLTYLGSQCTPANIGVVLGLAAAGLGILCVVILAATHRRRRRREPLDPEEDEMTEDDAMSDRIRRL
jgi:hypothetical protein